MIGYVRIDTSALFQSECFLIPTISISKWSKGFELTLHILWFTVYSAISYITEHEYES